jgi:hypothetical protein
MADKKAEGVDTGAPEGEITNCILDVTHTMQMAALVMLSKKYMHLMNYHENILASSVATLLMVTEKHFPGAGDEIIRAYRDPQTYHLMAHGKQSTTKMH